MLTYPERCDPERCHHVVQTASSCGSRDMGHSAPVRSQLVSATWHPTRGDHCYPPEDPQSLRTTRHPHRAQPLCGHAQRAANGGVNAPTTWRTSTPGPYEYDSARVPSPGGARTASPAGVYKEELLSFIINSSHASGCAFRCHPHGDNCRPQGHEPPHQRGSIQQTCERHATISMRYRTASPAGVYKEPVPRDPLLLAPYEWMCLSLPFIRGTREGSKGRPRRGCQ